MKCYTDASYCPKTKLAVCGYYLPFLENSQVNFTYVENTTNTEAEVIGLVELLEVLDETGLKCTVYTDSESTINNIQKRTKKSPLFDKIYCILDRNPDIALSHIQGHKPKGQKTDTDAAFAVVDKAVRKELRKITRM